MWKRNWAMFSLLMAFLLLSSIFTTFWVENSKLEAGTDQPRRDVYVLVHINDDMEPGTIKSMLNELQVVIGIQFDIWVGDNTTSAIWDAKARIAKWLSEFPNYKIMIQCVYAFDQKYGYYETPFWKYNTTQTLSQEWYTNWYGNLSEILNAYPNVKVMVGFNEPYNHFEAKEMAQTIIKREYSTWKNMSTIPFSVKLSMPYITWANYWGFPKNASLENDYVPYWESYSDYIGIDLWADHNPPDWYSVGTLAFDRVKQTITTCEFYSDLLKKPILIDEYPAWDKQIFEYICDHAMRSPNIGQVYQLWYWAGQKEAFYDGSSYALFNIDTKTHIVTKGDPEWDVFRDILNPAINR